jgi:hypothetical protein
VRFDEGAAPSLSALGVRLLSPEALLSRHLLPGYPELVPQAANGVKGYLRTEWTAGLRLDAEVVEALRAAPFLTDGGDQSGDGDLRRAAELLDPSNPVLAAVFRGRPELFPAEEFCRAEWLPLLRDVGLRSQVSISFPFPSTCTPHATNPHLLHTVSLCCNVEMCPNVKMWRYQARALFGGAILAVCIFACLLLKSTICFN